MAHMGPWQTIVDPDQMLQYAAAGEDLLHCFGFLDDISVMIKTELTRHPLIDKWPHPINLKKTTTEESMRHE